LLHDYFSETARKQEVLDSLSKTFHNSATFSDFYRIKIELDSAFAALFAEQKKFAHRLVSENPGSLASLLIFNRQFAGKKLFDPKEDAGLMLLLDSLLMKNYPGNSHVEAHHNRVQRFLQQRREDEAAEKRLAPGKTAPPLNLPDTSGRMITLKSLQGNIVLLCFWASYSPESRACLQQLKNVYTKYHKAGFRVYAVSFDHKRSFWANVIRMEQLPWINVSDLKGLNSPVKILYHLNDDDIPYFYLIDKSGKIILKGDDLNAVENLLTAMQ
jgi:peroxiredoxin